MTTISQLTARIKFSVDTKGLKQVNTGLDDFKKKAGTADKKTIGLTKSLGILSKTLLKIELGFLGITYGLSKLVTEQARSATQAQIQSNFYDIQIGKLMGLSDAYKIVGGSMATSLGATQNFQNIQAGMLMGNVPMEKIKALGVAGAADLIPVLLQGTQGQFQSGLIRKYDQLLKGSPQQKRQAYLLRQAFPEMIKDATQQGVLMRAAGGKSIAEITRRNNELRFGTANQKEIRKRQHLAQRQAYEFGQIGLGLEGNFMAMGRGFAKSFNLADMKKFQDTLIRLQDTSEKVGKAFGDMSQGFMKGTNDILDSLEKLNDFLDKHGIKMKGTLEAIGTALAYAFPVTLIGILAKLVTKLLKISGILGGIKATAKVLGGKAGGKAGGAIMGDAIDDVKKGGGKGGGLLSKLIKGITTGVTAAFGIVASKVKFATGSGWSFMKNSGKALNIGKNFMGAQTGIYGSAQAPSLATQLMPALLNVLKASTGLAALLYSPQTGNATLSNNMDAEQLKRLRGSINNNTNTTNNNTTNATGGNVTHNTNITNNIHGATDAQLNNLTQANNSKNTNSNNRAN